MVKIANFVKFVVALCRFLQRSAFILCHKKFVSRHRTSCKTFRFNILRAVSKRRSSVFCSSAKWFFDIVRLSVDSNADYEALLYLFHADPFFGSILQKLKMHVVSVHQPQVSALTELERAW